MDEVKMKEITFRQLIKGLRTSKLNFVTINGDEDSDNLKILVNLSGRSWKENRNMSLCPLRFLNVYKLIINTCCYNDVFIRDKYVYDFLSQTNISIIKCCFDNGFGSFLNIRPLEILKVYAIWRDESTNDLQIYLNTHTIKKIRLNLYARRYLKQIFNSNFNGKIIISLDDSCSVEKTLRTLYKTKKRAKEKNIKLIPSRKIKEIIKIFSD